MVKRQMARPIKTGAMLKQIYRLHQQGYGKKAIARITGVSKTTVRKYLRTVENDPDERDRLLQLDDQAVEEFVSSKQNDKVDVSSRREEFKKELEYFKKEITERKVTRMQLWIEYREHHPDGYSYSQFCEHLQKHLSPSPKVSFPQRHEPGDMLFMDFTGKGLPILDPSTGEFREPQTFVAVLGYSQYGFVRSVETQGTDDLVEAMVKCFEFLGGVPRGLMPDNLKSAVIKADRYEPTINRVLEDLANHYGTTVVPARARKPRDKALAESLVNHTYDRIYAPLRDRTFHSLKEQNEAFLERLAVYNRMKFQKKEHDRQYFFDHHERAVLLPLPRERFELRKYRDVKVRNNAHVELSEDKHYYSVPMEHIGKKVRLIYTKKTVTIYHETRQIACHKRDRTPFRYTTLEGHLPSWRGQYQDRHPRYYLEWAGEISEKVEKVVEKVIGSKPHPEQAYRSCEGIQRIDKKFGRKKLLRACELALAMEQCTYSFLKNVIENGVVEEDPEVQQKLSLKLPDHDNIRGKENYQ